jgi:hypothetical protein
MAAAKLTGNAVAAAMAGDTNLKPVVQVVDLRSIAVTGAPGSGPRFRAIISDGVATGHALFASQLCDLARSGVVRRGSVVQLLDYIVNNVGPTRNRKYLSLPSSLLFRPSHPTRSMCVPFGCALVGLVYGSGLPGYQAYEIGSNLFDYVLVCSI